MPAGALVRAALAADRAARTWGLRHRNPDAPAHDHSRLAYDCRVLNAGAASDATSKVAFASLCSAAAVALVGTAAEDVRARLSPVPIDVSMQATVAGSGSVSAVLTGTKLAVTGTFDGLKSPATIAQIHKSPVRGVRGPNVLDLTVAKTDGDQRHDQRHVRPHRHPGRRPREGPAVRAASQREGPGRQLWGWLLPQENKR